VAVVALTLPVRAADVADVRNLLRTGEYGKAITQAEQGLKEEPRNGNGRCCSPGGC
jgi:hypothetical protein